MDIIDIFSVSPSPKKNNLDVAPSFSFKKLEVLRLPFPSGRPSVSFLEVLNKRVSVLGDAEPHNSKLSSLLFYSVSTKQTKEDGNKLIWRRKSVASAGGLHANNIFVIKYREDQKSIYFYDDVEHSLYLFEISNKNSFECLLEKIKSVTGLSQFTCIVTACDLDLLDKKYSNSHSLAYRDAGCIFSTIELTATSLDLNCCQLGITCEPFLSDLLGNSRVVGTGACILSARG